MADNKKFPNSEIPIRKSKDLLPTVFQTPANDKFLSGHFLHLKNVLQFLRLEEEDRRATSALI